MNVTSAGASTSAMANAHDLSGTEAADSPDERKLKKAAADFESILLASMWKGMKQSFGTSETDDSDPAQGTLSDWGIELMSGAVAKGGGLGISKMILKALEPSLKSKDSNSAEQPAVAKGEQSAKIVAD